MNTVRQVKQNIADYWHRLSERERRLVGFLAPVIGCWLIWLIVITPLLAAKSAAQLRMETSAQMLARVQAGATKLSSLKNDVINAGRTNLPTDQLVNSSAGRLGIRVAALRNQNGYLQVSLGKTDFQKLIHWLVALEQAGVGTRQLVLKKAPEPGFVVISNLELSEL